MTRRPSWGFSLAEIMLAVGLLSLVLLTLVGMTLSALRSNQKAALLGPATQVTDSLMNRTLYQVVNDQPPGTRASFWAAAGQWQGPTAENIGGVDYEYVIYANPVPLGGVAANNRVKKVDLVVWWYDTRSTNNNRQGYGRMQAQASRLVNEFVPP